MIDAILTEWAARHGLHVQTRYRDEEVRSVDVVDDQGARYQVWLVQRPDGDVEVNAWDHRDLRTCIKSTAAGLPEALEAGYLQVLAWIGAARHTRTPVG